MYKIKTMNAIARKGIDYLERNGCEVSPAQENPEALLVRSAALRDMEFNDELLCIARAGSGYDNIPFERCAENGIVVFNTPGANADAVKELAICALMMASRDVLGGIDWVRSLAGEGGAIPTLVEKGKNSFVGPEIAGKSLGIIGLGAVGSRLANAATLLGMDVYGYDPYLSVDAAWNLSSEVHHVTEVEEIYRNSDYITIHIPYLPDTNHHLIDAAAVAKMKDGVRILNLARDELMDDDAILAGLESGHIARFVTDFPNEKLVGQKNVVAFPHMGASTPEAEENCAFVAAQQIVDYLKDGNIRNSVNLPNAWLNRLGESRLCVLHRNQPKMLNQFLEIVSENGINVSHMMNKARGEYAYTIIDTDTQLPETVAERISSIEGVRRLRLL